VLLHDEQRKMTVDARLTQTLHEFREAVFAQHGVSIAEDVLIMVDREVVGEDMMIWDEVVKTINRIQLPNRIMGEQKLSAITRYLSLNPHTPSSPPTS